MRRLASAVLVLLVAACAPRLQEPGPLVQNELPPRTPELSDTHLLASDGLDLPYQTWGPEDGEPTAVLIGLHGFNDYSNAFAPTAPSWAEAGILTYAIDQRGFGDAPERGVWAGVDVMVRDLAEMAYAVRARHPNTPLYLVGISMGGAVIMVAEERRKAGFLDYERDGVVLVSPAVWGREAMPGAQVTALNSIAHVAPWFPVSGEKTKKTPSDNTEMLRSLGRDPKVIKVTRFDAVYGLVNLMDAALAASYALPPETLILIGEREDIVPTEPTNRMLATLPEPGPRVAVYPNGHHMLLRDLNAEVVHQDVVAWVRDPAAPLPSGADQAGAERVAAARTAEAERVAQIEAEAEIEANDEAAAPGPPRPVSLCAAGDPQTACNTAPQFR